MDTLPQRLSPAQTRLEILTYLLAKGHRLDNPHTRPLVDATYAVVAAEGEKPEILALRYACLRLAFGRGVKPGFEQLGDTVNTIYRLVSETLSSEDRRGTKPAPAPEPAPGGR